MTVGDLITMLRAYPNDDEIANKRQIRTHPRLGTSSDFVVLVETAGLESGTAFYHGKKVIG